MADLVVADVLIPEDAHGRFNLNVLHSTSGHAEAKHPGHWIKRKSTKALIVELEKQLSFSTIDVVKGGDASGTYAHELLAISYAGWISPAFQLKVNQAFLDMKRGKALPQVKDPKLQMLIEAVVRIDTLEQQLAVQHDALIANQQATIQAQDLALRALQTQAWMTLRQYVLLYAKDLIPIFTARQQQEYGKWLVGYCREHGLPVYKTPTVDMAWPAENTYHAGTIQETLAGWLMRQSSQPQIALVPRADTGTTGGA